jgi:hypothetical protein
MRTSSAHKNLRGSKKENRRPSRARAVRVPACSEIHFIAAKALPPLGSERQRAWVEADRPLQAESLRAIVKTRLQPVPNCRAQAVIERVVDRLVGEYFVIRLHHGVGWCA